MKKWKLSILFLLLIISILGIYVFLNKNSFFIKKSEISTNTKLETPNITSKNLAKFYLWTAEDPLFTSPNFDANSFETTIRILEEEENAYIKQFKLTKKIFPTQFLKDLIKINKIYKDFILNPDLPKAKNLISSYKIAATDYRTNINELIEAVKLVAPPIKNGKKNNIVVRGINTVTNLNLVYNDLELIRLNADKLDKEILARESCLEKGENCIRPVNNFSDNLSSGKNYPFTEKDILPQKILTVPEDYDYTWYGPYIISTQCLGLNEQIQPKSYPFYLIQAKDNANFDINREKLTEVFSKLATSNYYRKPSSQEEKLYGEMDRIWQLETNNYTCPSIEYKTKLTSVNYLYQLLKNKKIFNNLPSNNFPIEIKNFINQGIELENTFFNSKFPSDTDAENLVNYYGLFYKKMLIWINNPDFNNNLFVKNLFAERFNILNVYLNYKSELTDIDQVISHAISGLYSLRIRYSFWEDKGLALYTYTTRSFYGLYYLPFSPTVYRLNAAPEYILKIKTDEKVSLDKHYLTYQEALKYYSKEEINTWQPSRRAIDYKAYQDTLKKNKINN